MVTLTNDSVVFQFYRPDAQQVFVAGDFNGWRLNEVVMARNVKGYWEARVHLPAGEFRFRYCADGRWFTDYAAFGVEYGPHGLDSVVRVPVSSGNTGRAA
jgi:1,4-alpha-glucan branching enzyme